MQILSTSENMVWFCLVFFWWLSWIQMSNFKQQDDHMLVPCFWMWRIASATLRSLEWRDQNWYLIIHQTIRTLKYNTVIKKCHSSKAAVFVIYCWTPEASIKKKKKWKIQKQIHCHQTDVGVTGLVLGRLALFYVECFASLVSGEVQLGFVWAGVPVLHCRRVPQQPRRWLHCLTQGEITHSVLST